MINNYAKIIAVPPPKKKNSREHMLSDALYFIISNLSFSLLIFRL